MLSITGLSGLSGIIYTFDSPNDISNLLVWLRSDIGVYQDSAGTTPTIYYDDPVGFWQDQSGNSNHAVQSPDASKPIYKPNFLNNYPATLRFLEILHLFRLWTNDR